MNIKIWTGLTILGIIAGYFGYLKLSNTYLKNKVERIEKQAKHDIIEAHIKEIDFNQNEKLKEIERLKDENTTIKNADINGSWSDTFGVR